MVLKGNLSALIQDFDILDSFIFTCCDSANACGYDQSQFPADNMFAAVGEALWDNGGACGRQYLVTCTSAPAPGACIPGEPIGVIIVGYATSEEGISFFISRTGYNAIANSSQQFNIDYKLVS